MTAERGPAMRRQRPVRRTVDLTPDQHRRLDLWQRDAADQLGLARVRSQAVLSAIVDELLTSPDLAKRVIRRLALAAPPTSH